MGKGFRLVAASSDKKSPLLDGRCHVEKTNRWGQKKQNGASLGTLRLHKREKKKVWTKAPR